MQLVIDLRIFFIFFIFIATSQIKLYLLFFCFIFFHELAHILSAKILGMEVTEVSIGIFGFSARIYCYGKNNFIHRIIMYLSGPICNLVLAFLFYVFRTSQEIMQVNFLLGILNLIPIIPLDGGRVVKEILKQIFGYKKANIFMIEFTKFSLILLSLSYSIAILKLKNIAILLLIIYLWWLYYIEEKRMRTLKRVYGIIEKSIEKN